MVSQRGMDIFGLCYAWSWTCSEFLIDKVEYWRSCVDYNTRGARFFSLQVSGLMSYWCLGGIYG